QCEVSRAEGSVLAHPWHEQLVVGVLEDDPDAAADLWQVGLLDRESGDLDRARAGPEDPVEVQYQRGLAGAVGAEERYALTSVDVQTHAEKGLVAVRVRVGQTAN